MKSADILLYGIFGRAEGCITAKSFVDQLTALQGNASIANINVRINSPGGSLGEGIAIYNAIAGSTKEVNCTIDGIAYSMAAVVALAGKKVFAAKNSALLLHACSGNVSGNCNELLQQIENMQKLDNAMSITIADKTGLTVDEVKAKWMDYKDHTLSAQEMLAAKLIDEVLDVKAENIPADLTAMSTEELFAFYDKGNTKEKKNFFAEVKNLFHEVLTGTKNAPKNYNPMNLEKTLAALEGGATAEQRTAAIAEVKAFTGANEKFTKAELDAAVLAEATKTAAAVKVVQDEFEAFKKAPAGPGATAVQKQPDAIGTKAEVFTTEVDAEVKAYREKNGIVSTTTA